MIKDLILKNRSYRRFHEDREISESILIELVELARLGASSANLQPLKYIISNTREKNEIIFRNLAWAGYLQDWDGPCKGERPSAYLILLLDTTIKKKVDTDQGIAAQNILLGAVEKGFGGCIIGSIKRNELRSSFNIAKQFEILLVLALGKPKEIVVLEDIPGSGSIKYWRDKTNIHHVPKRALAEIIIKI